MTISHNVIENNGPAALQPGGGDHAFFGGGIYSSNATITVTHNTIRNNNANRGGGLNITSKSDFTITDNLIEDNSGYDDHGGGVVLNPLPIAAVGDGTFARNVIRGNVASKAYTYGWAGGVLIGGNLDPASLKPVTLNNNIYTGNSAPSQGGALFVDNGATVILDHELIYKNSTTSGVSSGGAIFVDGDAGGTGSTLTIKNSTIADNISEQQNGNGVFVLEFSQVIVSNSIFWGNTDDFFQDDTSTITVTYTDSQEVLAGTGNIHADPLFADSGDSDYHLQSTAGRFDPTAQGGAGGFVADAVNSPAIDAGNPAAAFANEPFFNGGRLNLGFDGNTAQASKSVNLNPDIVLDSVTANGKTTLTVQYRILDFAVSSPITLRFLQSTDNLADAADTVLSNVTISNVADLAVGSHTLNFTIGSQVLLPGSGKPEVATDYFLLAVADPANTIAESDNHPLNEDNTVPFVGAYATTTTIHLHGGSMADTVTLTYPATTSGNVTLGLAGSISATYTYAFGQTAQFWLRTHDGNDTVNIVNASNLTTRPMLELGGNGDDILNGAAGADALNGGTGNDTLSGGLGNDSLDGGIGTNTLRESGNVNFTLTNTSLSGVGTDKLANLQVANLTGGTSSNTFTASGWTGAGSLIGGGGTGDTIAASKNVSFTLANAGLQTTDGMNLSLSGFGKATLTGGAGGNTFTVGGWTGIGTLSGGGGTDTLVATRDANMTLTTTSLTTIGFGTLTLSSLEIATLTGGAGSNSFNVSGWNGTGTLTGEGGADSVIASRNANFTLSDSQLSASNGLTMTLANIAIANLTGGSSVNVFTVTGWTGSGQLDGLAGTTDKIIAVRDTDMTLTNTSLVAAGFGTLTLAGMETATLSGGATANKLIANQFTLGSVTLQGNGGDDLLIGGLKNDSLDGGTGRDVLIGGAGIDSINGGTDEDILIGGTTTASGGATRNVADFVALNAIMAEWSRTDANSLYANRIANLQDVGVGSNAATKLNSTTVQNDSAKDTLKGSLPAPNNTDLDWFFQSSSDVLDAIANETKTAVL